jgi:glycine/D-amino acid oxidase-like deaminating enzyme
MASTLIGRQAVVVGAGIAGLSAARAVADYFEHVIVLERDALPADASPESEHLSRGTRMLSSPAASGRCASFSPALSRTSPEPGRSR